MSSLSKLQSSMQPFLHINPVSIDLPFEEYQDQVNRKYKKFKWSRGKLENQCIKSASSNTSFLQFHNTQDFLRHYFIPQSPVKGMLLWLGTGVGKTAAAIATATSSWEKQGYNILWITRTTLKNDMYKNMFDDIASVSIRDKIINGQVDYPLSDIQSERRKLMSRNWIGVFSYRQFSNLGQGNPLLETLVKRNGSDDPLRNTLLIIDEAHKLYGGTDLKSIEKPDTETIEKLIFNSYKKSGAGSVRVMLMTATPIVKNPIEICKLLNLCIGDESHRFPTGYYEYMSKFLRYDKPEYTRTGVKLFQEKAKGLISFLNKNNDPRQFANMKAHTISVKMETHSTNFEAKLLSCDHDQKSLEYECSRSNSDKKEKKLCIKKSKEKRKSCIKSIKIEKKEYMTSQEGMLNVGCLKSPNPAQCMRKVENFAGIKTQHRFDSEKFSPDDLAYELPNLSPKITALLKKIEFLDEKDRRLSGKVHKHVIFSDVTHGYGAKILTSAFIANGWNLVMTPKKNQIVLDLTLGQNYKNVALLSSTAIYHLPINSGFKRDLIGPDGEFNKRPSNIHGKNIRIIILDAGFKEGIDLYDVRYLHIFEDQTSSADRLQVIGRARRLCSQRGLLFKENHGWDLDVYEYQLFDKSGKAVSDKTFELLGNKSDFGEKLLNETALVAISSAVDRDLNGNINRFKLD